MLTILELPNLLNIPDPVKYRDQERDVMINLENEEYPAYPFPATFYWSKDSKGPLQNDSRRTFGYPSLVIGRVKVSDAGRYSLTATNYILSNPPEPLGTSIGRFTLDVLCECNINYGAGNYN